MFNYLNDNSIFRDSGANFEDLGIYNNFKEVKARF